MIANWTYTYCFQTQHTEIQKHTQNAFVSNGEKEKRIHWEYGIYQIQPLFCKSFSCAGG